MRDHRPNPRKRNCDACPALAAPILLAISGFPPRFAPVRPDRSPAGRHVRNFKNGGIVRYDILQEHNHSVLWLHFISMVKLPAMIIEVVRHSRDISAFFQDVRRGDDRAGLRLIEWPIACGFWCWLGFAKQVLEDADHDVFWLTFGLAGAARAGFGIQTEGDRRVQRSPPVGHRHLGHTLCSSPSTNPTATASARRSIALPALGRSRYAVTKRLAASSTTSHVSPTSDSGSASCSTSGRKDSSHAQSGSSALYLSDPTISMHHGSARLKLNATTLGPTGWLNATSSQASNAD